MQLSQLRIHQTHAKIGIQTTKPTQEIKQKPAEILMKQVPAKLTITKEPALLEIDQEKAWDELGFKRLGTFMRDMAEFSRQECLRAIEEIAAEGDTLAAIENKSNAMVNLAVEKALPQKADFNIAFIPSHGSVKIHYTPSQLELNWEKGGTEMKVNTHKPEHTFIPGKTEIYLRQKQHLEFEMVGSKLDISN